VAKIIPKKRDPEATKRRILAAATVEFAKNGLGGARVDVIAARAKANKRMMYHYFGNKDALFQVVLEDAYGAFRDAEAKLELQVLDPIAAMRKLVTFIWTYFLDNPEFITLVNSENLHKAKHVKTSTRMKEMSRPFVGRMAELLVRGEKAGVFRLGLDPVQVHITLAAINYYYITNRFTGSIVFERDLMSKAALEARLAFNIESVLHMICVPSAIANMEVSS
jgi:AcrR family transcriptional regulator